MTTAMPEHAILVSKPLIPPILADTKTQTRRLAKFDTDQGLNLSFSGLSVHRVGESWRLMSKSASCWEERSKALRSPYGLEGETLWVRETFYAFGRWETRFNAKKGRDEWHFVDMTIETGRAYAFDEPIGWLPSIRAGVTPNWWKRPAIFMPRVASRITLTITEVRIERLQGISEDDAVAEGIREVPGWPGWWSHKDDAPGSQNDDRFGGTARDAYRLVWEEINGAGTWAANPFVFVITFRRQAA